MRTGNEELLIIKIANGWIVSAPVMYNSQMIGGMDMDAFRDTMLDIASQTQVVKEPILRNAEREPKSELPKQSVANVIDARIGEFYFATLHEACEFVKTNFQ